MNKKTLEKLAITDQREQCELPPLQVVLANMEWAIGRAEEAAEMIDRAEGIKDLLDAVKELEAKNGYASSAAMG